MLRVAVVGHREKKLKPLHLSFLNYLGSEALEVFTKGGDAGVEKSIEAWSAERGFPLHKIQPDWAENGERASLVANRMLCLECDFVVIFEGGRESEDMAEVCRKSNVPVIDLRPAHQWFPIATNTSGTGTWFTRKPTAWILENTTVRLDWWPQGRKFECPVMCDDKEAGKNTVKLLRSSCDWGADSRQENEFLPALVFPSVVGLFYEFDPAVMLRFKSRRYQLDGYAVTDCSKVRPGVIQRFIRSGLGLKKFPPI